MSELNDIEKLAVSEAVHSFDHRHDERRFHSKYGCDAKFYNNPDRSRRDDFYQSPKYVTRLKLFFYWQRNEPMPVIPSDLVEKLKPMVPAPAAAFVPCTEPPVADGLLMVRTTESEALADLGALLRLADQGNLAFSPKTGLPSKNTLHEITAILSGGDWFPDKITRLPDLKPWDQDIGEIKPIGWSRMLHAAGLIEMKGSKSVLTDRGRRAVAKPAWQVIAEIWDKWTKNKHYDEFNRIDIIKGQSVTGALTARVDRRYALLEALASCPSEQWIPFDGFSKYMRAGDLDFEVSNDPWRLYISDRKYGSLGYSGYGGWDVLQDRYLLCVIMEYVATLGLVDIAYKTPDGCRNVENWGMDCYAWLSRYDGLQAFRINCLGEYVLGGAKTEFCPTRATPQVVLMALSNLTIRVASGILSPIEKMQLEAWAEQVGPDTFRLDEMRAMEAIETGKDADEFIKFLEERDSQSLPETICALIKMAKENGGAVRRSGGALLFECRDARTAELISACKELSSICYRVGDTSLVIREEGLPKFQKQVRTLGFGIR